VKFFVLKDLFVDNQMHHKHLNTNKHRLLIRAGHWNVVHKHMSSWKLWKADFYHTVLNLSWGKMLAITISYYICLNSFFATVYWFDLNNIGGTRCVVLLKETSFFFVDCFYIVVVMMLLGLMRFFSQYKRGPR